MEADNTYGETSIHCNLKGLECYNPTCMLNGKCIDFISQRDYTKWKEEQYQDEIKRLQKVIKEFIYMETNFNPESAKEIYRKHWKKWVKESFGEEEATDEAFEEISSQHIFEAMEEYANLKSTPDMELMKKVAVAFAEYMFYLGYDVHPKYFDNWLTTEEAKQILARIQAKIKLK